MAVLIKKGSKFIIIRDDGEIIIIPVSDIFSMFSAVNKKNFEEFKVNYLSLRSLLPPKIIREMFIEFLNELLNIKEAFVYHSLAKALKEYLKERAEALKDKPREKRWVEYLEDEKVFYIHEQNLYAVYLRFYKWYRNHYGKEGLRWERFLKIINVEFTKAGGMKLKVKSFKSRIKTYKKILKTFEEFVKKIEEEKKKEKILESQTA